MTHEKSFLCLSGNSWKGRRRVLHFSAALEAIKMKGILFFRSREFLRLTAIRSVRRRSEAEEAGSRDRSSSSSVRINPRVERESARICTEPGNQWISRVEYFFLKNSPIYVYFFKVFTGYTRPRFQIKIICPHLGNPCMVWARVGVSAFLLLLPPSDRETRSQRKREREGGGCQVRRGGGEKRKGKKSSLDRRWRREEEHYLFFFWLKTTIFFFSPREKKNKRGYLRLFFPPRSTIAVWEKKVSVFCRKRRNWRIGIMVSLLLLLIFLIYRRIF